MSMSQDDAEQMGRAVASAIHEHWGLFLAEGIVLAILGLIAIAVPPVATLAVTIIIGGVFLASGIVGLITTFWARQAPGFWWALVSAIIAIGAGLVLLLWPISGTISLTLLLIAFFVVDGIASIMYAIEHGNQLTGRWVWMLVSGIVELILAGIIFAGLPGTATWVLGLLVSIDLVIGGAALSAMALAAWHPDTDRMVSFPIARVPPLNLKRQHLFSSAPEPPPKPKLSPPKGSSASADAERINRDASFSSASSNRVSARQQRQMKVGRQAQLILQRVKPQKRGSATTARPEARHRDMHLSAQAAADELNPGGITTASSKQCARDAGPSHLPGRPAACDSEVEFAGHEKFRAGSPAASPRFTNF